MLGVEEALQLVIGSARLLEPRSVGLRDAAGRFLAADVRAAHDSPPFDTSAMDGMAVRAADLRSASAASPVLLPLDGEVSAGANVTPALRPGAALRINTGAPLPAGADAVVRIEDVVLDTGAPGAGRVSFSAPCAEAANLRRRGEDFAAGSVVLTAGRRLNAAAVGVLASLGCDSAPVTRPPRVALFSTGDEIVEPGQPLPPGSIYNSSRYALMPLLAGFGAEVHDMGRLPDEPAATLRALERGLDFDAVVTTGGVSMGSRDFVRPALHDLGAEEIFWKVRQRPGKPLVFATHGGTLFFGLPGNPVSVFVTALVYVRAALLRLQGASDLGLPWRMAAVARPFRGARDLTVFARADLATGGEAGDLPSVVPAPAQGSHQFSGLASSAGLVLIPEGTEQLPAGDRVRFLSFEPGL